MYKYVCETCGEMFIGKSTIKEHKKNNKYHRVVKIKKSRRGLENRIGDMRGEIQELKDQVNAHIYKRDGLH